MAGQEHSMCVYVSDRYASITVCLSVRFCDTDGVWFSSNRWNHVACRARRPISSIVLDPGVSDVILEDARDFLRSKPWYAERGIPFRRGYLLYGSPGSGKTSLIHCMAGELMLDVYIISLSRAGLDDASLSELVNALPERCLALMEDIDAAFTHGVTRNLDEENNDPKKANAPPPPAGSASTPTPSRLSLSGLLNALDGVGAQEGRILFATTNRYSALDEALCRPGRMDLHIEFKDASKYQARELFKRFYLPTPAADSTKKEQTPEEIEDDCSQLVNDKSLEDKTPPVDLSIFKGQKHTNRAPVLSRVRIDELAQRFADSIPDREHSMASLQGFLMSYKTRPVEAVDGVDAWLEKEKKRKQEKEKEKTEMKKKETEKSKEDGLKNSDNEKEEIKQTGKESEKTASVPDPLRCNCSPVCSVCGGVKPAAEEVVLGLPSPISKPATPVEGSTQESLTLENAILSLPAGA
ncbi:hypothetical protein H0H92_009461 [Tricholoma furcatifolium]|nr:hypothetical protein H0H92_009461 [Tricholoma furcatifolium]